MKKIFAIALIAILLFSFGLTAVVQAEPYRGEVYQRRGIIGPLWPLSIYQMTAEDIIEKEGAATAYKLLWTLTTVQEHTVYRLIQENWEGVKVVLAYTKDPIVATYFFSFEKDKDQYVWIVDMNDASQMKMYALDVECVQYGLDAQGVYEMYKKEGLRLNLGDNATVVTYTAKDMRDLREGVSSQKDKIMIEYGAFKTADGYDSICGQHFIIGKWTGNSKFINSIGEKLGLKHAAEPALVFLPRMEFTILDGEERLTDKGKWVVEGRTLIMTVGNKTYKVVEECAENALALYPDYGVEGVQPVDLERQPGWQPRWWRE